MACLVKNCSIKGEDERMIVCLLCDEFCHFKCSGLSGLVAEAIPKNKGLHWCCESCRKIGVNFYRFFQDTKKKFLELQDEAVKLNERINAYGKLFDDFKSLDNLKSPPLPSPKRRKSARNTNKEKRDNLPAVTVCDPSSSVINNYNVGSPNDIESNSSNPQLNYAEAISNTVTNNAQNINNPSASKTDKIVHNILRAVPPKKTLFVSRLTSDTTSEAVDYYIKNKIGNDADTAIQKFNFSQPRFISSFKITVSSDLFATLLDPNFWPKNTLVREYVFKTRSQNIGVLPLQDSAAPKN